MANYKSENVTLGASAEKVFTRLSNLEGFGDLLQRVPADQIPADQRGMLEQVKVTADTISFPGGPVGDITLVVTERVDPTLIRLEGQGTPVPMGMALHITPINDEACEAYVDIDVKVPMMLAPLIGGTIQKMADQFGRMLRQIPFD
ncbi:MAG: DUF2505 domain-containing protein [Muribaculaceae bacterium]|nr:DUF2505 domain-containing protein [Muribaculaceae bacterium]